MNIYLDLDGVILGSRSSLEDCVEFVEYLLDHFAGSLYWLTTHCNRGENHVNYALRGELPDELVDRMLDNFKETDFGDDKTNAIDFSKPFLWFDDCLTPEDKRALEEHDALASHVMMDDKDPQALKKALALLKSL